MSLSKKKLTIATNVQWQIEGIVVTVVMEFNRNMLYIENRPECGIKCKLVLNTVTEAINQERQW